MEFIKAILFSKDRPLQCRAAVESFYRHCLDPELVEFSILYTGSTQEYLDAYATLPDLLPYHIIYQKQNDFKEDVLGLMNGFQYVLFLVDDNVFCRDFKLFTALEALNNPRMLCFSLRMGIKNTIYCYPMDRQQLAQDIHDEGDYCWVDYRMNHLDWGYPMDVSSTVHRKEWVEQLMRIPSAIKNPNELEYCLDYLNQRVNQTFYGLGCYAISVAFCNAVNKVNPENQNRSGSAKKYSIDSLLKKFQKGYRIDLTVFDGLVVPTPHMEMGYEFIR